MIYAPELRLKARNAMKAYLPFALLVTLLASIPSLVLQMAASFSGNSIINAVMQYQYADFSVSVLRKIIAAASQNMSPFVRTLWVMLPFLYLAFPFLDIGRNYFTLRILRGAQADTMDLFARVGCFFKAILLQILMTVKMILWGLPGFAVMVLGAVIFMTGKANVSVFTLMYSMGFAMMMALMIRANLHYLLAPILMADIPEKSAWGCLKESIGMMRRRVMQLLSVIVSFILYMLLVDLVVNLFAGISYGLALTINLLLNLLITCYMRTTVCAYYEERIKENRRSELDTPAETETAENQDEYLN